MAIDFPSSPTVGQVFIFGAITYIWDGTKWTSSATDSPFSLGSAATPSITFIGDGNTGIYSPGADQVSITTGGTERFRVDAAGQLEAVNLGTAAAPVYSFTTDPNTGIYSPGADQLAISTNGTGRLFVDSSGRVGVGISSPGANLEVLSSSSPADVFISENTSPSVARLRNVGGIFRLDADVFNAAGSSSLLFGVDGTERARITSDGRLGLGTSSPGTLLDVVNGIGRIRTGGKAGSNTYLKLESTDASNSMELQFSNSTNANWSIQSVENGVSNRSLLLNPSGGNVGIGSNFPNQLLHINSSAASGGQLQITNASTGTTSTDGLLIGYDGSNDVLINNQEATALKVNVNGSERARITSDGKLLVGTSSSLPTQFGGNARLQVATTDIYGLAQTQFANTATESALILAKSRGASVGTHTVVQNNDALGGVFFEGSDGTGFIRAAGITTFVDGTPGTNDMPGRLVFSTTADGASSPTERMRVDSAGRILGNNISIFATGRLNTTTFANGAVNLYLYTGSQPSGTGSFNFYQQLPAGTQGGIYQVAAFGGPEYANVGPGWAVTYALFSIDYDGVFTTISSNTRNSGDAGMTANWTTSTNYVVFSTQNQGYQNYPMLYFNRIGAYL